MEPAQTADVLFADFAARLSQKHICEQSPTHPDFVMNAPEGQFDSLGDQGIMPGEHMIVDAVDQSSVEIEEKGGFRRRHRSLHDVECGAYYNPGVLRLCCIGMTMPCIITVAITGSLPRKENNPAVPITASEQIESTHEAFEDRK